MHVFPFLIKDAWHLIAVDWAVLALTFTLCEGEAIKNQIGSLS